ncbi:MAG: winged helix DNA-binding domain-containing protein [Nocardioidaceae bacterium]
MTDEVLTTQQLNRASLARQYLLERHTASAAATLEHLVGLQAQEPQEPYVGLWSRLNGFEPAELVALLEDRDAVRTALMRRTIHLLTARDTLALRPLHQPMLVTRMLSTLRRRLPGIDFDQLAELARPLFAEEPRGVTEVARLLADRWPEVAPRDLGDALTSLLPLVQVPPRGIWRKDGSARQTTIESWLGRPLDQPGTSADELVLRYLAAYGPASSADVRAWSGLTGLRDALQRLRPGLRTFRDERRRELFDIPDGTMPDAGTPAPPRFLPAFDNAVLGFDDRSRIIDDAHRRLSVAGARFVLVDGRVAATWTTDADIDDITVRVRALRPIRRIDRDAVVAEGESLLAFLTDGSGGGRVDVSTE